MSRVCLLTTASMRDHDERAGEAAELHRPPEHRPQHSGRSFTSAKARLPARHVVGRRHDHPAGGQQHRAADEGHHLARSHSSSLSRTCHVALGTVPAVRSPRCCRQWDVAEAMAHTSETASLWWPSSVKCRLSEVSEFDSIGGSARPRGSRRRPRGPRRRLTTGRPSARSSPSARVAGQTHPRRGGDDDSGTSPRSSAKSRRMDTFSTRIGCSSR